MIRTAFAILLLLPACPPAAAGDYHISYLWHPDLASVEAYREKLAGILGPDMARRLSVVKGQDNFGLVYPRRGGLESARTVAGRHSRILASKGLERAVPIPAEDWGSPSPPRRDPPPPSKSPVPAGVPQALERRIENYIKALRRSGRVKGDERTSWVVYDFTTGEKLVSINEDLPLDAASLMKPFISLAWLHEVSAGRKKYGSYEKRRMEDMIQNSDNVSARWFMQKLGGPARLQKLLKDSYPGIFKETRIVEYIPVNGRTYRNQSSAHDYSRFLYALWKGELTGAEEIKRLMNLPNPDRVYTSAPGVPAGTEVYDKTGSTSRLCGDMGILVARREDGREFPYIIVGIIEKSRSTRHYSSWMRSRGNVIRRVSELVYEGIKDLHDFEAMPPMTADGDGGAGGADGEDRS